jgi:hypothetical protein
MIGARDLRDSSCGVDLLAQLLSLPAKLLAGLPALLSVAAPRFGESVLALLNLLAQPLLLIPPFGVQLPQPRLPRIPELSDTLLGLGPVMHRYLPSLLPDGGAETRPRALLARAERSADLLPIGSARDCLPHEVALPIRQRSVNPVASSKRVERRIPRQQLPGFGKLGWNFSRRQSVWTILLEASSSSQAELTRPRHQFHRIFSITPFAPSRLPSGCCATPWSPSSRWPTGARSSSEPCLPAEVA